MPRTGRVLKLTPAIQQRIVAAIQAGATCDVAAGAAGIDRATFFRWKARGQRDQSGLYRDFYDQLQKAGDMGEVTLVAIIRAEANRTWQAAAWLLERRAPDRWGRRDRLAMDVRHDYERTAESLGLDVDEIMAAAEAITSGED